MRMFGQHASSLLMSMVYNLVQQVTCVYLFHELPPEVRRAAAAEMARVLKPGGLLVLTDSIQLGDRARIDANLVMFETFNEPYYRSFISEDFGAPSRAFPSVAPFGTCMPISLGCVHPQGVNVGFRSGEAAGGSILFEE
jgi:SAM-dependent methyltransferase